MLAVLPLRNLDGRPEDDYFSDGVTEEMIGQLGTFEPARLGVIARTTVMQYRHSTRSVGEIGRDLGVDYVVEGSVRRNDGRVRITARLVQVSDQTQVWAETYDASLDDVLHIQRSRAGGLPAGAVLPRAGHGRECPPRDRLFHARDAARSELRAGLGGSR
jgi:TolB-like protein